MKTLLLHCFLYTAILLFPGCYTIVFMGGPPPCEDVSFNPDPTTHYDPEPWPIIVPPPDPGPQPPRHCPPSPIQVIGVNNSPSSSDNHREIHTGRSGPFVTNPSNDGSTRDSGGQKVRR